MADKVDFEDTCSLTNAGLIRKLQRYSYAKSENVEKAMLSVDRANYCPYPNIDVAQDIGYGAGITTHKMQARALEALKNHLIEGKKALDIGSGSGYMTACMATMVGPSGKAIGIDHIPELVQIAIANVTRDNAALVDWPNSPNRFSWNPLTLIVASGFSELGDGRQGFADEAPYDAIHVGAAAPSIPRALIKQLKPGGRIVMPVGAEGANQVFKQIDKLPNGQLREVDLIRGIIYQSLSDREHQITTSTGPRGGSDGKK